MADLTLCVTHEELVDFFFLMASDDEKSVYNRACYSLACEVLGGYQRVQGAYLVKMEL